MTATPGEVGEGRPVDPRCVAEQGVESAETPALRSHSGGAFDSYRDYRRGSSPCTAGATTRGDGAVPGADPAPHERFIRAADGRRGRGRRRREGVKMAQDLLLQLRPYVQGVCLMPSFGRYEVAAEVLRILD